MEQALKYPAQGVPLPWPSQPAAPAGGLPPPWGCRTPRCLCTSACTRAGSSAPAPGQDLRYRRHLQHGPFRLPRSAGRAVHCWSIDLFRITPGFRQGTASDSDYRLQSACLLRLCMSRLDPLRCWRRARAVRNRGSLPGGIRVITPQPGRRSYGRNPPEPLFAALHATPAMVDLGACAGAQVDHSVLDARHCRRLTCHSNSAGQRLSIPEQRGAACAGSGRRQLHA